MRTKTKQLYEYSSRHEFDIFIIVETWLNDDFHDGEFFDLNLYTIYRKNRNPNKTGLLRGGGVLLAVNKQLNSSACSLVDIDDMLDQLFILLKFPFNSICLGVSYIPPNSNLTVYSSHIDNIKVLHDKMDLNTQFCIFGDFNLSNIYWSNSLDKGLIPTNINKDSFHFKIQIIF